jgi:hypothetical protein
MDGTLSTASISRQPWPLLPGPKGYLWPTCEKPTRRCSPWQNGYVERLIGSIRRDCLDRASSSTMRGDSLRPCVGYGIIQPSGPGPAGKGAGRSGEGECPRIGA